MTTKEINYFDKIEVVASTDGLVTIVIREDNENETRININKGNTKWLITALKQAR